MRSARRALTTALAAGALVVFAGAAAWLVLGILSFAEKIDGFQRVTMPQGGQVSLDHSGDYVIYYEGPGATTGAIPSFFVHVRPASRGSVAWLLTLYASSQRYNFGSHHGCGVLTLQVTHPGRFTLTGIGVPAAAAGSDLAVGTSLPGGIVSIVGPSESLMLLSVLSAVLIFIIRIFRRSRLRVQAHARQGHYQPPPANAAGPGS